MQIHIGRSLQETTATRKHALKIIYSRNTQMHRLHSLYSIRILYM